MKIRRLELGSFRCYASARFEPDGGITVLYGRNAQGKTNLMEAIVLCSIGRSHRTNRDREMIAWDQPRARVSLEAAHRDGTHDVKITLTRDDARVKQVCIGASPVARIGDLMGHVPSVLFSPEDLKLIKEGPGERRRFMDMAISQVRPAYFAALQQYTRVLRQRNELLRALKFESIGGAAAAGRLDPWNELLCDYGSRIIENRAWFLNRLAPAARDAHNYLSETNENLEIEYEAAAAAGGDIEEIKADLGRKIYAARKRDEYNMGTGVGPHRDDFSLSLNGRQARVYGSQGQQRTAALALKLAALAILEEEMNETPVLLLDDVMSELDAGRRRRLLTWMGGVQTIITCADINDIGGGVLAGKMYRVNSMGSFEWGYKDKIDKGIDASKCVACGACEAACPQNIAIIDNLAMIRDKYN
ncbi:MAG: DNA replication/repair protein RecF [Oscillospiraceae bacterium]|jgi:DNA replication and repair protein RecF|nr:DNA replication/repair protein RecF [Oscillospiraceae bacterium]